MQIGLARHFLVPHRRAELLDADGFGRWVAWYDDAQGECGAGGTAAAGHAWDVCYSSDLRRARVTAERLHAGPARGTPLLREVPFGPVLGGRVPLPLMLWQALARLAWLVGHRTQPEGRRATLARAGALLDHLCAEHPDGRVLVVGHGFLMQVLAAELRRRGFRGRVPLRPRGGEVYVFARD
jgi:broad specificity phosphatase PhoE